MKFSHTVQTKANSQRIWRVWINVPEWKRWDYQLEYSRLNGKFTEGATGVIKSKRSVESRFLIEEIRKNKLVISIDIPLSKLKITRTVEPMRKGCTFTHETSFEGPFGFFYGLLFGARFKRELPIVMGKVATIASS